MADDHVVVPLTGRSSLAAVQETDVDPMTESISDFALFLRAEGKSPYTIKKYCEAVRRLHRYAVERGAKDWTSVTKPMIRAWLATIGDVQQQAAHVSAMQSGAKSFFNFLEDEEWEGTGRQSPMRKMPCPKVNRPVIDVLTQDKLAAIIAKCKGSPRDEAIVRLLFDTGIRRAECAGITLDDLDLSAHRVLVHGKGNKDRWAPLGIRSVLALKKWLRTRSKHPRASMFDALWLGERGPMTDSAIYRIVKQRAAEAGIEMHPHMFRHTWAHEFRMSGGQLDDLCQLAGWTTMNMALRYGASAAAERAEKSARTRSLGDKL